LEGRMEGKRGRGRRRQRMIDDIMEQESYEETKRRAEDRSRWKGRSQQQQRDTLQKPAI